MKKRSGDPCDSLARLARWTTERDHESRLDMRPKIVVSYRRWAVAPILSEGWSWPLYEYDTKCGFISRLPIEDGLREAFPH